MREALIQARNAKGLTQKQLATAAKISVRQYRNIEAGKCEPGVETAISIAKFLGYGVTDLFAPAAATAEDTTYPDYSSSPSSGIAEAKELSEAAKGFEVDVETVVDIGLDGRLDCPERRKKAERLGKALGAALS